MFKHILVPTDGSALSAETVGHATRFAAEAGARVTFLYVQPDYPVSYFGEGALVDPTTPESFYNMTAKVAEEVLKHSTQSAREAGVEARGITVVNDLPYEAIIQTAEQEACDLILMTSHGHRGLANLLLGSETQKVLSRTRIPVLVYRSNPGQ